MVYTQYPKGSEWRRWDLHVHTPFSNGYKGTWEQFISQIKVADCEVVGINDYASVSGYKKLMEEIELGSIDVGERKFLPVVEMRMTDTVQNKNTESKGITHFNFHIIFNNDEKVLKVADIENFIKSLTSEGSIIGSDYEDKEKICKKKVSFKDTLQQLRTDKKFIGNYLIWLPYDEYGGIDEINPDSDGWIKENFIRESHILGSSRKKQIDFFLWDSPKNKEGEVKFSKDQFKTWFGKQIPCIKGSDSHSNSDKIGHLKNDKSIPINKFCWIKADPTFEGLRQIVYEPEYRIRIQEEKPEEKVSYSVIESVRFKDNRTHPEFGSEPIQLNQNLNSIIGGKSSGKSLLLYHIAKTIDPVRIAEINADKKHRKLAYPYESNDLFDFCVKWADEKEYSLKDSGRPNRPITFIPQLYLNRLAEDKKDELNELVDSMLLDSDESYQAFRIEKKDKISNLSSDLSALIDDYFKKKAKHQTKVKELKDLGDKKAIEEKIEKTKTEIDELRKASAFSEKEEAKYKSLQQDIADTKTKIIGLDELVTILEFGKKELETLKSGFQDLIVDETLSKALEKYPTFNPTSTETLREILNQVSKELSVVLTQNIADKFTDINEHRKNKIKNVEQLEKLKTEIAPLEKKIVNATHFELLQKTQTVEEGKLAAISDKEKEVLQILEGLSTEPLLQRYADMFECYVEIIKKNELYDDIPEADKLKLVSMIGIRQDAFEQNFQAKIKKKKSLQTQFGDFFSDRSVYKFNAEDHVKNLRAILGKIHLGEIEYNSGFSEEQATKALFDDYFYVDYDLLQDGDRLLNMSPGKMGIILFQLFLHLSKSKNPILIDQPEDNLDNRTVYKELNDFIKRKKVDRQIIIVSHNANLVVSTDSENIIVANQSGQGSSAENEKYKFEYINGSIEHSYSLSTEFSGILNTMGIREHVCEILEGGREAFEKREHKYGFGSESNR